MFTITKYSSLLEEFANRITTENDQKKQILLYIMRCESQAKDRSCSVMGRRQRDTPGNSGYLANGQLDTKARASATTLGF
jgi:hypothetical protein